MRRGAIILLSDAKREWGKEAKPESPEGEGRHLGEGVEEMNVEEEHQDDDEPPHYFLRRVKRRLVFRARVLRPLAD